MKKYSTLYIFLVLVAIWAAFFSSIKFFLWGELSSTLRPDLQTITGYLSFGSIFAYLIWWAFAATFLKKYYLFAISFLSFLFVTFAYFVGFSSNIMLAVIVMFLWFLYGLWSVVKNVIIAIEIKKTGISDTVINAIAGIVFVVFVIWGTLLGSVLFETLGKNGYLVIMWMLTLTAWVSLMLNYNKRTLSELMQHGWKNYYHDRKKKLGKALTLYIPDLWYILKNYSLIMLASAFLWAISTVVSQVSMEYSIVSFDIEASTASYIFLFSAVWAILGNIVSMKMWARRWKYWIIFGNCFSFLIIAFPFLALSFTYMSILAFFLWVFFGINSNLIDAFFIKTIGEEDKKEYGSSTYGLVLSIVIFLMMFLSSAIESYFSYKILMIFLWVIMFIVSWVLYLQQKK